MNTSRPKKRKGPVVIGLIAIGILALVLIYYKLGTSRVNNEPAANFQFDKIQRGNLEITVSSTGQLAAISTVKVGIQVSGTIDRVLVDYNNIVKKGQVLAVLDTTLLETDVDQAAANVEKADAEVYAAKKEYERNRPLFKQGALSAREFQQTETALKTTRAILLQTKASLKKARTNLDNAVIRAPINGTIIEKNIDAGQTVAASFSTPTLFTIAEDLSHMQIEAMVDETDIGQIKEKQNVRFTVQAYPDNTFTGVVRQIRLNSQVISNVVNYTVVINAENKSGLLLPGMTATVDFVVAFQPDTLLIPNGALAFTPTDPKLLSLRQEIDGQLKKGEPSQKAVFYYLDQSETAKIAITHKGLSNGIVTAIESTPDIHQEMQVITGYSKTATSKQSSSLLGRLMQRPGRPPR
jgi:HlyD family secretion protein